MEHPLLFDRLRTLDADVQLKAADVDWRHVPPDGSTFGHGSGWRLVLTPWIRPAGASCGSAIVDAGPTS
jgi:hypothetical protein